LATPILFVVLDGVGDRPTPERDNLTPLEAASTPNLDRIASQGQTGLLYTVKRGIAPESDAGVFSLLSYDPTRLTLSRGVVEALGAELSFKEGDLALRCNFATVRNGQLVDRRAGRGLSTDEATQLAQSLNRSDALRKLCRFELKATIGHRCSLVLHSDGNRLSDSISNLDPAYERIGRVTVAKPNVRLPVPIPKCMPLRKAKAAIHTARLLNEFSGHIYEELNDDPVNLKRVERGSLPANFLLMRDAGNKLPKVRTLKEKFSLRSVALADMPVELGIAKVLGMDVQRFDQDRSLAGYRARARKALELLVSYDLVYVHLKGPDEPGHDGDFEGKTKAIEDIDAGFFAEMSDLPSGLLCVTADHSTPCSVNGHSDDPVPLLVAGNRIQSDTSERFTEAQASKGRLGIVRHGYEIMGMLAKLRRGNP